jgi:hypothetical protein
MQEHGELHSMLFIRVIREIRGSDWFLKVKRKA